MRYLIAILLLCQSLTAQVVLQKANIQNAQIGQTTPAAPPPADVGTIFTDNFNRGALGANWTSEGSPNATITGNQLSVNNTSGNFWTSLIRYNGFITMGDHWEMSMTETVGASSGAGAALYFRALASGQNNSWIFWIDLSDPSPGRCYVLSRDGSDNISVFAPAATSYSWAVGDQLFLRVVRTTNSLEFFSTNLTSSAGSYVQVFMDFPKDPLGTNYSSRSGEFAIGAIGGTTLCDNFSVSENVVTPVPLLIVGDSITAGYGASLVTKRWASSLGASAIIDAGDGATTADMTNDLAQMLLYKPLKVLFMIGGNNTDTNAPFPEQYTNVVNALVSQGATVYHDLPTPRNTADPAQQRAFLIGRYPSTYIDTWIHLTNGSAGLKAAFDTGDGIHLNDDGNTNVTFWNTNTGLIP